ncbi:MAG: hypothetical protein QOH13_1265 [Thermoleophilaceae bacterium]|nr:hypothetical protein [Thermoleophilaceae bacterium]
MMYPFESLRSRNGLLPLLLVPGPHGMNRAAAFLATLAVCGGAPAAVAAAPSCHIPGGHTVATGSVAKLISIPAPGNSPLYACIRRSGRKVLLDDSYTDARLAGRWVAWERAGRPGHERIAVHDLRTGKERLVDGHVAAHSLLLTARGTIVWAQRKDDAPDTPVFSNDVVAGGQLLDDGAVDPASLRLAGRRASWLSGGKRRSAVVR